MSTSNEYRTALQNLIDRIDLLPASRFRFMLDWMAYMEAKALLARPEPEPCQRLYVFMEQRPSDKQAWPLVFVDRLMAEACKHRVTPVVPVDVPLPSPPAATGE